MEEVLGDEEQKTQQMAQGEDESDMKGIDFSQVQLSAMDKNSTKTLIEDDNFDFQVTNP